MKSGILISLAVLITVSYSRLSGDLSEKLISILKKTVDPADLNNLQVVSKETNRKNKNDIDIRAANNKAKVIQRARDDEDVLDDVGGEVSNHKDPVLNIMNRLGVNTRRRKALPSSSESESISSSLELKNWKSEWNDMWMKKKMEALNSTGPKGDMVNMVAARPWGVPCGDPNQHDMPWGTCMLAAECEAEYRIYRGDYYCGRTHFVCCALQLNTYDMYQGFDVSFADSSLQTDSSEKRNNDKHSKERQKRKKARERRRRKRNRETRKRKIKRNIKKMVREVEKILNKSYRNESSLKRKKTKTLKKFLKYLKKKYRKDRETVKDIHEVQLVKIDQDLMNRLKDIRVVNQGFMQNDTFRQIIMNGTMSAKGARMLVEAYPELNTYIRTDKTRRKIKTRRGGGPFSPKDYLEYDVEYGLLYY